MDTLLRRRQMFASGVSPGPQTIAYIRGAGNNVNGAEAPYIDTGIKPDSTTKVVVWARNWNPGFDYYNWLFGARNGDHNRSFAVGLCSGANTGKLAVCYGNNDDNLSDKWPLMSHYHKYELSANGFYVDNTLVSTVTAATFATDYNIHLFGYNNGGNHSDACALPKDICACKIYKGDVLVRDFSPTNSPAVGFYDSVSRTVFTNVGVGSLSYGTFNPAAYTPLEYVSCEGQQYFDSGVKATHDMIIIARFRPTSSTPRYHSLLGTRVSNSSCDMAFGTSVSNMDNTRLYWRFGPNTNSAYAFNGSASDKLTGLDLIAAKRVNVLSIYESYSQKGTATIGPTSSFTTTYTMGVGDIKNGDNSFLQEPFYGRYYFVGFGASRAYVPAKVSGVAGLFDTYNDTFYPSVSGTHFIAGPEL